MANETEVLAGLRVLIAVAKVDGAIHEEEKRAMEATFADVSLPPNVTLEALLEEDVDLDAQIAAIASADVRHETYRAAVALTNADGECSSEEQAVLDRLREAWEISGDEEQRARDWLSAVKAPLTPNVQAVDDPAEREKAVSKSITAYSIVSAILGAFPIPGAALITDVAVIFLQRRLIAAVALYYGRDLSTKEIVSLYGAIAGTTAIRIAVSNIVKLVPIWGAATASAASFASTWALGKVVEQHFQSEGQLSVEELAAQFKAQRKEGASEFKRQKEAIAAKEAENREKLDALKVELETGKITQDEFDARVAELVD
ncbi:MAG TPA: TerB family tellurite resistance protein [Polyangiaceae bacterium]|nr:TerB family tellurite resistance protein [Polyangiaceae bacterium]